MILLIIFVVSVLLALFGSLPAAEPYRPYASLALVIAVICLGVKVFGGHL